MAEAITVMDIDVDHVAGAKALNPSKGKAFPADSKATPWVEKYRPQSLDDVAAHRDIVDTIDRLTSEKKLPHLLLYGPPGTGKTSTILAVARKLYGVQYHNMILELNASDDRGIDIVRQQIQDFASTQSFCFGYFMKIPFQTCAKKKITMEGKVEVTIIFAHMKVIGNMNLGCVVSDIMEKIN